MFHFAGLQSPKLSTLNQEPKRTSVHMASKGNRTTILTVKLAQEKAAYK